MEENLKLEQRGEEDTKTPEDESLGRLASLSLKPVILIDWKLILKFLVK